jgi:hypothetical protein
MPFKRRGKHYYRAPLVSVGSVVPSRIGPARGRAAGEPACRPGSVHQPKLADGHPSRAAVAGSLVRSTHEHRAGRPQTLAQTLRPKPHGPSDLAPGGVYLAARITPGAGGLLHHRFTLTPG